MKPSIAYERAYKIVRQARESGKPIYAYNAGQSALGQVIEISDHGFVLRPIVMTRPALTFDFDDVEVKYPSQSEAQA